MAFKKQLEGSRMTRQGDPNPQVSPPPPKVVDGLASLGKFISYGTELKSLFLFSERLEKKGRGGGVVGLPGIWLVLTDLDLWGSLDPGSKWAFPVFCSL